MRELSFIILLSFPIGGLAQTVQQEINEQVWKPFIETFNSHDTKGFMTVHSNEAIRAPRDAKTVWDRAEYYKRQEQGDVREKASNTKRFIELRFSERIDGKNLAVDVGIYKTRIVGADGIAKDFYGKFHVVFRKENGHWKILVDTDSSEGGTVSEKDFLAAAPME